MQNLSDWVSLSIPWKPLIYILIPFTEVEIYVLTFSSDAIKNCIHSIPIKFANLGERYEDQFQAKKWRNLDFWCCDWWIQKISHLLAWACQSTFMKN